MNLQASLLRTRPGSQRMLSPQRILLLHGRHLQLRGWAMRAQHVYGSGTRRYVNDNITPALQTITTPISGSAMLNGHEGLGKYLTPICAPNGGFSQTTCPTLDYSNALSLQNSSNSTNTTTMTSPTPSPFTGGVSGNMVATTLMIGTLVGVLVVL